MPDKEVIERIVASVGDLPAMPAVVSEVLRMTDDPASDMAKVSSTIQADPAMTAKILRVSNSPYYGMKQYVGTLKLALVILGVREVRNIVLGISVFETLKDAKTDAKLVQDIWHHSLQVAGVAKNLGATMGLGLQGEEFITGLLSDIGKMVLLRQMGERYGKLLTKFQSDTTGLCQEELLEVGCTHADLAMALAAHWNLPQSLCDSLWYQYSCTCEDRSLKGAVDPKLAAVVRIAKSAVYDDFGQETLRCLEDAEAWEALRDVKNPIPEEKRREVLEGYVKEVKDAPQLNL